MTIELNLRELNCAGIIEHYLPVYHCKAALKQSVKMIVLTFKNKTCFYLIAFLYLLLTR